MDSSWETPPEANQGNTQDREPIPEQTSAPGLENLDFPKLDPQELGWVERKSLNYQMLKARSLLPEASQSSMVAEESTDDEPAESRYKWAHAGARYEWIDEYGEVGPKIPKLEQQLFQGSSSTKTGDAFSTLLRAEIDIEGPQEIKPIAQFKHAGLHPVMLENVELCGYQHCTPIQSYAIPTILLDYDLLAVSQTGSGKTAAYLVPVISKLMGKAKKLCGPKPTNNTEFVRAEPLVLILAPTRELADQIFCDTRKLCYRTMLRPCLVYGGGPRREQLNELKRGCDILIGTPGRVNDYLITEPQSISMHRLKYTILDEADEILKPDWRDEMTRVLESPTTNMSEAHRYLMFSATFPEEVNEAAQRYLSPKENLRITVGIQGASHKNVIQKLFWVAPTEKRRALVDLICSLPPCRTMVFTNSSRMADILEADLYKIGFPVTTLSSSRTQWEREAAINSFRAGFTPILVATDVAARGIDVKNVMHVINFDLPTTMHGGMVEYIHRIGRTARIGNKGQASSFYNDKNSDLAADLVQNLIKCDTAIPDFLQAYVPGEAAEDGSGDASGNADEWGAAPNGATNGEHAVDSKPADGGNADNNEWGASTSADQGNGAW